jgi:hypothetical protein
MLSRAVASYLTLYGQSTPIMVRVFELLKVKTGFEEGAGSKSKA